MKFNTVSVIGLGYIGLPTAAMFASRQLNVIGVDVNQHAVDTINQGKIHIVEPALEEMVQLAVSAGYLKATVQAEPADAFLIAVPTPFKPSSDSDIPEPDLSYIQAAAIAIAAVLKKGDLVILESTSPVGATEQVAGWLAEARPDLHIPKKEGDRSDVYIAHCPERVLPGQVVRELVENDRVIGGITNESSRLAVELYEVFVKGDCVITNARTAEMAKLTENSCRDVQIAFANELSIICDGFDIDVWELISLANRHPRINILQPGPGVGGHCIAVDPWFIVSQAPEAKLIHTARKVNDGKPHWVIQQVEKQMLRFLKDNPEKTITDVTVGCFGLAFKANIDDLRESPALDITKRLAAEGGFNVIGVEPNVKTLKENIELLSVEKALAKADICVLLVDHIEFREIKPSCDYIVDTKGLW